MLNVSEQRVSSLLADEQEQIPDVKFDNIDQRFDEIAQVMEASYSPKIQEIVDPKPEAVQEVEPLIQDNEVKSDQPLVEQPVVKEEEPELSEDDKVRINYLKELQALNTTDKALLENLETMMSMGYLNFEVNLKLLLRSKNDLVIAINKLCNNMVGESIFEGN